MKIKSKVALCAATLGVAATPATALAAGATAVKVRIEGPSHTLVHAETVRVRGGFITRYGAKPGACPARSMAGALDVATRHRWRGTYGSGGFADYLITSILGVTESGKTSYWGLFVNNRFASSGACETPAHAGDQFLFAVVPAADTADYVIGVSAPKSARIGIPVTVKVVFYDLKGKPHPLAGARLSGAAIAPARTDAHGLARVIPTRRGTLVLTATHAGYGKSGQHYGYVRGESAGTAVGL